MRCPLQIGPQRQKTCLRGFANNTGADQSAHPHSLISAFVIHFLENIICRHDSGEISIFLLVSVAEVTGLKFALSESPKTGFLMTRPNTKGTATLNACASEMQVFLEVRNKAKIRSRYNQVPHLTQDTTWQSDKNTGKHHIQKGQEVSPFPAGNHKAAMNRHDRMTDTKQNNKKDLQKKHHLGMVNKKYSYWNHAICGKPDQN